MSEAWQIRSVRDIADLKSGKNAPKEIRSDDGLYRLMGANGEIGRTTVPLERGPLIIVGRVGANCGEVTWVPRDEECWVTDNALIVRPKRDIDIGFLKASLELTDFAALRGGSSQPLINQATFDAVAIAIPPLPVQRQIMAVLGALDALIETNQRLILSAGDLWRSLVRRSCAADSEARPLSSIADFINGRNFTKGATGAGRPVIRTPEVRSGPTASTVRSAVGASEGHVARSGDVLFVWSGSLTVNRWAWEDGLINQHVFKVRPTTGIPEWLVMAAIESQMPWFRSLAADKATTMGHIQRRHLDEVALVPAERDWPELNAAVRPLWDLEISLAQESNELRRTRDELLPLLMSGRVSPGEVDLGV